MNQGWMPEAGASSGSPLDYVAASRDREIPQLVREALRTQNCMLVYQPVYAHAANERIIFHESLIRLRDGEGQMIPAAQFIAYVEDTEIGREVDLASLREALWALSEHPELVLSVNVSARSFADGAWRRVLFDALSVDADILKRLILEISEKSAISLEEIVIRFMEEMQPHGLSFALDDFGAGLTAFAKLRDSSFDIVKINRGFTDGIDTNRDSQVMCGALVSVAKQFNIFTVATGIEREEEAQFLRSLEVDALQGFYFSMPRSAPIISDAEAEKTVSTEQPGSADAANSPGATAQIQAESVAR